MGGASEDDLLFSMQCLQRREARKAFRKSILTAWDQSCAYCGSPRADTLDHVTPKAKGGSTTRDNLVACCAGCNLRKSDSDWFAWYRSQEFWSAEREAEILAWVSQTSTVSILSHIQPSEGPKLLTQAPDQRLTV